MQQKHRPRHCGPQHGLKWLHRIFTLAWPPWKHGLWKSVWPSMVTQARVIDTAPSCYRTTNIYLKLQFQHGLEQWAIDTKVDSTDLRDLSRRPYQKMNHPSSWVSCPCSAPRLSCYHGWAACSEAESEVSSRLWFTPVGLLCNDTSTTPLSHEGCVFIQGAGEIVGLVVVGRSHLLICIVGVLFLYL